MSPHQDDLRAMRLDSLGNRPSRGLLLLLALLFGIGSTARGATPSTPPPVHLLEAIPGPATQESQESGVQEPGAQESGAQDSGPEDPGAATPGLPPLPTADAVRARLAELGAADDTEDRAVTDLRATYEETLAALKAVEEDRARASASRREAEDAPARIAALRRSDAAEEPHPDVPEGLTFDKLSRLLDEARATLEVARQKVAGLDEEAAARKLRRETLVSELAEARTDAAAQAAQLASSAGASEDEANEARNAARGLARARLEALRARAEALVAEEASHAARKELDPLLRELAAKLVVREESNVAKLEEAVAAMRKSEAERALREAEQQVQQALLHFPALQELAEQNQRFADLRDELSKDLDDARRRGQALGAKLLDVQRRFVSTQRKIAVARLSDEMGRLLRREIASLPSNTEVVDERANTRESLSTAQLQAIEVEEAVESTAELVATVRANTAESPPPGASPEELAEFTSDLFATRKDLLRTLSREYPRYLDLLLDQHVEEDELQLALAEYRTFIEERLLWIRSIEGPSIPAWSELAAAGGALLGAREPRGWSGVLADSWATVRRAPFPTLAWLGLWAALLGLRPRLRRRMRREAEIVRNPRTDGYGHTLRALVTTLLLALTWPAFALGVAHFLLAPDAPVPLAHAVGAGLRATALTVGVLAALREFTRPEGLAGPHFRWPARGLESVRWHLHWMVPAFLACAFLTNVFDVGWDASWNDSAGRMVYVLGSCVLIVFLHCLINPRGKLLRVPVEGDEERLLQHARLLWYVFFVGVTLAVTLLALFGYYHTSLVFGGAFGRSVRFLILVVLIYSLFTRWLYIDRRRLALQQAQARAADADDGDEAEASQINLPAVTAQTRQLLRSALTFALCIGFWGIWSTAIPGLQLLEQVELWPRVRVVSEAPSKVLANLEAERAAKPAAHSASAGTPDARDVAETAAAERAAGDTAEPEHGAETSSANAQPSADTATNPPGTAFLESPSTAERSSVLAEIQEHEPNPNAITLYDALLATLAGILTILLFRNLPGVLEITILQRLPLDAGARYTVTTLVRYSILILGGFTVSQVLGVTWHKLQWMAAALTFGLGFGLQEIFANFVSGLIILLERPIRLGDIVVVGGVQGKVTRLSMRATTITDWDRRELLIPNKEFVTGSLVNHTLSDSVMRVVVDVHLVYGTDTALARRLMEEAARAATSVLDDPAPSAVFVEFGECAVKLQLRLFREASTDWATVMNEVYEGIERTLREADIEFAFPRRELDVRQSSFLGGLLARGLGGGRTAAD